MQRGRGRCVSHVVASSLMLLLLAAPASAQSPRPKNVNLCNGVDRTSPEPQIAGCTALIDSGEETALVMAIAHNNRGNAYLAKGEHDRAIRDYNEAIRLDPKNVRAFNDRAFNNRGVAYRKKGDFDRALQDLDEAIRLNPSYAIAFANRADVYEKRGEHVRAVRDYDEAIRLDAKLEDAWLGRCWTRAVIGELEASLADCNKALQLRPSGAAFGARGLVHLKMDQFELGDSGL